MNLKLAFQTAQSGLQLVLTPEEADLQDFFRIHNFLTQLPGNQKRVLRHYSRMEVTARGLIEKNRLGYVDLQKLSTLPCNTLGRVYYEHLKRESVDPSAFPTLPGHSDFEYIAAHLFETHDIWHVILGLGTTVEDELKLQAFSSTQSPSYLPSALCRMGILNVILKKPRKAAPFIRELRHFKKLGRNAKPLFGMDWNRYWDMDLETLREILDLGKLRA